MIFEPIADCTVDFRLCGFAKIVGDVSARLDEFDEVYMCVQSQAAQEVHQVLCGEVAAGPARVRTPAQPRDRRVHRFYIKLQTQDMLRGLFDDVTRYMRECAATKKQANTIFFIYIYNVSSCFRYELINFISDSGNEVFVSVSTSLKRSDK